MISLGVRLGDFNVLQGSARHRRSILHEDRMPEGSVGRAQSGCQMLPRRGPGLQ
jgi:hypothetical protein